MAVHSKLTSLAFGAKPAHFHKVTWPRITHHLRICACASGWSECTPYRMWISIWRTLFVSDSSLHRSSWNELRMREWVELYPRTPQYLQQTSYRHQARWAIATNSKVQVCHCDWTSAVVDKSNWLVNHYVIFLMCEGVVSQKPHLLWSQVKTNVLRWHSTLDF